MSFREELSDIDLNQIETVFDDIFPLDASKPSEANQDNFILQEVAVSGGQFPVFRSIQHKLQEMAPRMIKLGVLDEDKLQGMLMGITVVQLVLSGYAEREIPDTLPPDF